MEEGERPAPSSASVGPSGDDCLYVLLNPWDPGEVRIGNASQTIEKLAPCENLSLLVKHAYPGLGPLAAHYHARFASLLSQEEAAAGRCDRAHWFRLSAVEADLRIREDVEERIQRCKDKIARQCQQISALRAAVPEQPRAPQEAADPSERSEEEGDSRRASAASSKSRASSAAPKKPRKLVKEKSEKVERFTVVTKAGMRALFKSAPATQ